MSFLLMHHSSNYLCLFLTKFDIFKLQTQFFKLTPKFYVVKKIGFLNALGNQTMMKCILDLQTKYACNSRFCNCYMQALCIHGQKERHVVSKIHSMAHFVWMRLLFYPTANCGGSIHHCSRSLIWNLWQIYQYGSVK